DREGGTVTSLDQEVEMSRIARWLGSVIPVAAAAALFVACGGKASLGDPDAGNDALADPDTSKDALTPAAVDVGDECVPGAEYGYNSGGAQPTDLTIDLGNPQCATNVCLVHWFRGRVSCPYGNGNTLKQAGKCQRVATKPGLFTLDGTIGGAPCCPVLGDEGGPPLANPVDPQCSARPAKE